MPLIAEYCDNGKLTELFGHLLRSHRLVSTLGAGGRVTILFNSPNGYISPSQAGVRNWAPTWNFAQLVIEAELTFLPDETGRSVAALVETMERYQQDPWTVSELGNRYAHLERGIGFRARVTHIAGRFKPGQDERHDVREAIIRSLGDVPLARWMRRFLRDVVTE